MRSPPGLGTPASPSSPPARWLSAALQTAEAAVLRRELVEAEPEQALPARHRLARRYRGAVPLAEVAGEAWTTGHAGTGWDEMTGRTCRQLGGFDPDIRHRANDVTIILAVVARGLAVAMLPELPLSGHRAGIAVRPIAEGPVSREIFAATRAADAARPSTQALLGAVRDAAAAIPH